MNFKVIFRSLQKSLALFASTNLVALSFPVSAQASEGFKIPKNEALMCPKKLFNDRWGSDYSNGFFQTAPYAYCKNKVQSFNDISADRFYKYLENHPLASLGKANGDWLESCGSNPLIKTKMHVAEYFYGMNQIRQAELTVNQAIAGINRTLGMNATQGHLFCRDSYLPETTIQCRAYDQCKPNQQHSRELTELASETFDMLGELRPLEDGLERLNKKKNANKNEIKQLESQISQIRFTYPWLNGKEFDGKELKFEPFGKHVFEKRFGQYTPDFNNVTPSYRVKTIAEIKDRLIRQLTITKKQLNDFKLNLVTASKCYNSSDYNSKLCANLTETMSQLPPLQLFDKNSKSKMERMAAHYFNLAHDCNDMRASKKMGHQAAAALAFAVALSAGTVALGVVAGGASAAMTAINTTRLATTAANSAAMSIQGPLGLAMSESVAASVSGMTLSQGVNQILSTTAANAMIKSLDTARIAQIANTTNNIMNYMTIIDVLGIGLDGATVYKECARALETLTPLAEYSNLEMQCPNIQNNKQQLVADFNACISNAAMTAGFYAIPSAVLLPRAYKSIKARIQRRRLKIINEAKKVAHTEKVNKAIEIEMMKANRENVKRYLQEGIEATRANDQVVANKPVANGKNPHNSASSNQNKPAKQNTNSNSQASKAPAKPEPRVVKATIDEKPTYPKAEAEKPAPKTSQDKSPSVATQPENKYSSNLDDYQSRIDDVPADKRAKFQEMYRNRKEFAEIYDRYENDPGMQDKITGYIYHRRVYKRYEEAKSPTNKKIASELEAVLKTPQEKLVDNFKFEHTPEELSEGIVKYSTDNNYSEAFDLVKGDREMQELLAEFIMVHKRRGIIDDEILTKLNKAFRACGE